MTFYRSSCQQNNTRQQVCLNPNQEDHITRMLPSSKSELTIKTCLQSELLKQLCKYFVAQCYSLSSIEPPPIFDYSHLYDDILLASQMYFVCTSKVNVLPDMIKQISDCEKKLLASCVLEIQQVHNVPLSFFVFWVFFFLSKYPCDQAVVSSEVSRGDGRRAKGSISCGDETKQTSNVPFARSSQGSCKYEGLE